jgi:hypothetical protein
LLDLGTATPILRFSDTNTTGYHQIQSSNANFIINADPSNQTASSSISFNVDGSERMRVNSSGKLLIGATSFLSGLSSYAQAMVEGVEGGLIINSTDTAATSYCRLVFTPNGNTTGNEGLIRYNTNDFHMSFWTQGNERMRINSSGNIGIGTISPAGKLTLKTTNANGAPTGWDASYFVISEGDASTSFGLGLSLDTINNEAHISSLIPGTQWQPINYRASQHKFFITDAASNEAMRIDSSGNLMVNRSTVNNVGKISFDFYGQTENGIVLKSTWTGSSASFAVFRNSSNNLCGNITQNGTTSVNYSSASDYRLKENVVEITNGITRVKQLSPKRFNFIADKNRTVDGFLAHEAQTVVPEAVTGEKDGEKMQSIDQSKLVPLLTAALQEAIAKIETLEQRLSDAGIA